MEAQRYYMAPTEIVKILKYAEEREPDLWDKLPGYADKFLREHGAEFKELLEV